MRAGGQRPRHGARAAPRDVDRSVREDRITTNDSDGQNGFMTLIDELTGPSTELLQQLIRNLRQRWLSRLRSEVRADLLETYLEGAGLEVASYEGHPGRASIVSRIEGSDPTAPALCLMGHTDVVPVNPDGWSEDPFGGEVIDGECEDAGRSTCSTSRPRWPSPSAASPPRASVPRAR